MAKDNKSIDWKNGALRVQCGECTAPMQLRESKYGPFWGCTNYPECRGTHGAHPDGKPLGVPADKETKDWRGEAHAVFDHWYKTKNLSRSEGYEQLQRIMGLSKAEAHIGNFDRARCEELIDLLNDL